ncbi:MAG TPA: hypothetical protein VIY29_08075 [Ktedonobacteraceae bacterium]
MSGQKRMLKHVGEMVHPDDSTLLTYIDQPSSDFVRANVRQHLAHCEQCLLRYGELKRTADMLIETLAPSEKKQYYPPLTTKVLQSIQNPAAVRLVRRQRRLARLREDLALGSALLGYALGEVKTVVLYPFAPVQFLLKSRRKKPRNLAMASIPVVAIPAVLFLGLLAVFVVLASNSEKLKQFQPVDVTSTSVALSIPTIVPHPAITPTAVPVKVIPAFPETTATPGGTKPTISLCGTATDNAQSRIRFCGRNFIAGTQVQLQVFIPGGPQWQHTLVLVDALGSFQDSWVITDCKMVPLAVIAKDVTPGHTTDVSQVLQNIQFLNCSNPTAGTNVTH